MKQRTERHVERISSDEMLREFEEKYGMTTADFYARFEAGEFPDDGSDQFFDHMTWAGIYEALMLRKSERATG